MDMCQEGCFCQAGYIRDDTGKCISEEWCDAYLELSLCQRQLYNAAQAATVMVGVFAPTCTENGDFSAVQCNGSTGYCWCVQLRDGAEIGGTRIRGEPVCLTGM